MSLTAIFITADTVAELTGFSSGNAFLAARDRMEADQQFPPPMPTRRRPLIWRRDVVEAWISRQGCIPRPLGSTSGWGDNVVLMQMARQA